VEKAKVGLYLQVEAQKNEQTQFELQKQNDNNLNVLKKQYEDQIKAI
jgi:hypothetical protein